MRSHPVCHAEPIGSKACAWQTLIPAAGIGNRGQQLCTVRPVVRPTLRCAATKKGEELVVDFRPFEEACQRFPLTLQKLQRLLTAVAAKQSVFCLGCSVLSEPWRCRPPHLHAQQPAGRRNDRGCNPEKGISRPALQVKPALATVEKAAPSESFARVDYTPSLESAINEQARLCFPVLLRVRSRARCCCTDCEPCALQLTSSTTLGEASTQILRRAFTLPC